ncbi:hypothetical protein EV175_003516 [Coemansia sp. RSA 1933]|nr:hypothetical protein EV175_003516 [Coemansia sp. RSA 1933]
MYFSISSVSTTVAAQPPMKLVLQAASSPPVSQTNIIRTSNGQIVKSCLKKQCSAKQPSNGQYQQQSRIQQTSDMPRFVHFSADLVKTRWFSKAEPSQCASRDPPLYKFHSISDITAAPSLVLTPIRSPSPLFSSFEESPVVLETVRYTNNALAGTIKVHNLAFEKHLLVRLTRNGWKTVEDDVQATFLRTITGTDGNRPGIDRFRFTIPVGDLVSPADSAITIAMCVCYRVNGQEYWDNNKGTNYEFKLAVHTADKPKSLDMATVVGSSSTTSACEPTSTNDQHALSDAIKLHKSSNSVFTYGFDAPRVVQNHARASSPLPISRISTTDARRYMQYSEAKFSSAVSRQQAHFSGSPGTQETRQTAAPEPANLPMFSTTRWMHSISSSASSIYSGTSSFDAYSSYQTPSPIMHSGSPLTTASTEWMPYPRSPLLHC